MKFIYPFLNPIEWIKALRFARKSSEFDKSKDDLDLLFYAKILPSNMLHYGYFDDVNLKPEAISFEMLEAAQIKYAKKVIEKVVDKENPVLDVGCGMGGLSHLLQNEGFNVESLTPNKNQIEYINKTYENFVTHYCIFEEFESEQKFGTIITAESFQYIRLNEAFKKVREILLTNGRWIIVDYFDLFKKDDPRQKPHHLETFYEKAKKYNWRVVEESDISLNVLPTLHFANMFVEKLLIPLRYHGYEKLKYKSPFLYYLTGKFRSLVDEKITKESKVINPLIFEKERKYMFIILERN